MFTDTEIALINRADRDVNRIADQYQRILAESRAATRIWEETAKDLDSKLEGWINYAKKLEGRIENARVYLKNCGLSDSEIEAVIKG